MELWFAILAVGLTLAYLLLGAAVANAFRFGSSWELSDAERGVVAALWPAVVVTSVILLAVALLVWLLSLLGRSIPGGKP